MKKSRITLSSVFPFLSEGMNLNQIEAILKTECLLHDDCTIPASIVLGDAKTAALLFRNIDLVKSGVVKISVRTHAKDLVGLANLKSAEVNKVLESISSLSEYVHFDPIDAEARFRSSLLAYLKEFVAEAPDRVTVNEFHSLIDLLSDISFSVSYDSVAGLATSGGHASEVLISAAKIFYCQSGAANVGGDFEIPEGVWRNVYCSQQKTAVGEAVTLPNMLSFAHATVLDHFAVAMDQICRVEPKDILALREDGATKSAIRYLRETVDSVLTADELIMGDKNEIENCRKLIRDKITQKCSDEAVIRERHQRLGATVDDVVPLVAEALLHGIPMWGTLKKLTLLIGRGVSRRTGVSQFDVTKTPIQTYVSRLQSGISVHPLR